MSAVLLIEKLDAPQEVFKEQQVGLDMVWAELVTTLNIWLPDQRNMDIEGKGGPAVLMEPGENTE